jgi:hypothetical protein
MGNPSPITHDSTITPTKLLSELYLLTPGLFNLGGILNTGQNISFHTYKTSPALFHLSISTRDNFFALHSGSSSKDPVIAESWPGAEEKEFVVVQSRDKFRSKIRKDGKDQYSWRVSSSQWALKHDATDEDDSVVGKEEMFQWRRLTLPEGVKASFVSPNWKLVDGNTQEVHAVFVENWDASTERGQLQFRRSFGTEWEAGVL